MVSRIMRAYWAEGADIGDPGTLTRLAGEVGLDRAIIERLLSTDSDKSDVQKREAHSRSRGVNAVPTFLIAGKYVLEGAQPTEMWTRVIDELTVQVQKAPE
jgi:predicted DsbA family dithiol-disulfide isomerase